MLHHNLELRTRNKEQNFFRKSFIMLHLAIVLTSHFSPPTSLAAVSTGEDYSIEFEDINTALPEPTSPPRVIPQAPLPTTFIPPNTPPPYTIAATNDSFSFKIAQTIIDFGALTATNPVTRTTDISFSTPTHGAQIFGYANHPLMNTEKITIPDTTCDTGTCTQSIPSIWENDLTYGFGFRCESEATEVCGRDFSGSNSFKQFSDSSAKESPVPIILNQQAKPSTTARLIYKVNISGTQPVGGYSNTVTYLAIPNF